MHGNTFNNNQEQDISQLKLSRYFDVSKSTINRDIIALSDYIPFSCNTGRLGDFTLVDSYKTDITTFYCHMKYIFTFFYIICYHFLTELLSIWKIFK